MQNTQNFKDMMKNLLLHSMFSFLFLTIVCSSSFAQTFVKQDATGNNDGTSWENAYTDLSVALQNTTTGEIWVAEGVYKPGQGASDSSSTFYIRGAVELYGGFAGTEVALSERNLAAHTTTLSGDINDDDIEDDFSMNKSDNVQHIIVVDSLINEVSINGFEFIGGHTSDNPAQSEFFWRGGGIFSWSTIVVSNCSFRNCFGRSGAGIYVSPFTGGGSGSRFSNCTFTHNLSTAQAAGIFVNALSDINLTACQFINNTTTRGAFYPAECNNVSVNSCLFENNRCLFNDAFGGAFFNWQSTNVSFSDSRFINNRCGNGGVVYHDGTYAVLDSTNLIFKNCRFEDNEALDFGGGAIYAWQGSYTLDSCTFEDNTGTNGADAFNGGVDKEIVIKNSTFSNGDAGWGGAMTCYGANSRFTLRNNDFSGGGAMTSGGALINGFEAEVNIENCRFNRNSANFGGAMYCQDDLTVVNIKGCSFLDNSSTMNGGCINYAGGVQSTIDNCLFDNNSSDFGGAISAEEFQSAAGGNLMILNSQFYANVASTQGAALNILDINATLSNVVIASNFNTGQGAGGGLSINASDSNSVEVTIINSTIANNFAQIGAGIAQFTDANSSFLNLNLQNCIISNEGENYAIEAGTPTISSQGGNLSGDMSMDIYLTHPKDLNAAPDPMFVDEDDFDFHLKEDSPAIDIGVATGAPDFDIEGKPRVGETDAGAYEFQMTVGTTTILADQGQLQLFPNPVGQQLNLRLELGWKGELSLQLFNRLGQEIQSQRIFKTDQVLDYQLTVSSLPAGVYDLVISNQEETVVQRFVKL